MTFAKMKSCNITLRKYGYVSETQTGTGDKQMDKQ